MSLRHMLRFVRLQMSKLMNWIILKMLQIRTVSVMNWTLRTICMTCYITKLPRKKQVRWATSPTENKKLLVMIYAKASVLCRLVKGSRCKYCAFNVLVVMIAAVKTVDWTISTLLFSNLNL